MDTMIDHLKPIITAHNDGLTTQKECFTQIMNVLGNKWHEISHDETDAELTQLFTAISEIGA